MLVPFLYAMLQLLGTLTVLVGINDRRWELGGQLKVGSLLDPGYTFL